MKRHEARQFALQALYQMDVGKNSAEPAIRHVLEAVQPPLADSDFGYVTQLVNGTQQSMPEVDELLASRVEGWQLDRLARVDLNVLRLAVYELLHERDVDMPTIVNEAVELAKDFGSDESGKFVNGVLARILPVVRLDTGSDA